MPIKGLRWKCAVCPDFDLCSACYNQDKHDTSHPFFRFEYFARTRENVKVPPRNTESPADKIKAMGMFPGAKVSRGKHWTWTDQDGGNGQTGLVQKLRDFKSRFRSIAEVIWSNGSCNEYRLGYCGQVDLKCIEAAGGGYYYRNHLPVLRKCKLSPQKLKIGDTVKCVVGVDKLKELQEDHGGWNECMEMNINQTGIIEKLHYDQIQVKYDASTQWWFNQVAFEKVSNDEDTVTIVPGLRVVRGPDWAWGNQDGGEGHLGTVVVERSGSCGKWISVIWDNGSENCYTADTKSAYDLCVLDSGPSGVKHEGIQCDCCLVCPLMGTRWKCTSCFDFDLCSACYHGNQHDVTHPFWRYDHPDGRRFLLTSRINKRRIESKGIFQDAKVVRGKHWEWNTQDAGNPAEGSVLEIKPWNKDSSKSAARVKWENGTTNTYRLGFRGKVDLKCVIPASGGHFYKTHLQVLGKRETTPCLFELDDAVSCMFSVEQMKLLQRSHGGWTDAMSQYIPQNGKVVEIDGDGDVRVEYVDGIKWTFNPESLCKSKELKNFTRSPMDSEAVRTILDLGFDRDLVQKVVWRTFFTSQTYFSETELLLNTILDETNTQNTRADTCTLNLRTDSEHSTSSESNLDSNHLAATNSSPCPASLTPASATTTVSKESTATPDDDQTLAEKYRQLMEERQCKICMEVDARMTFVPCGHLVSCEVCSSQLKQCPMCRSDIEKVVKTYLV
ncbi:uncharacterized protein LOC106054167 isoform X2 [Biomphalaria glabrata]|nr:uncharacterized protein LOC106054167 isoform X2 [Biomphalaria glabrata]